VTASSGSAKPPALEVLTAVLGDAQAQSTASRRSPACSRLATPSTKKRSTANSLRSRPAKASYSCHSHSVTCLIAVRLSSWRRPRTGRRPRRPVCSAPARTFRRRGPRAQAVRPARPVRARDMKALRAIGDLGHPIVTTSSHRYEQVVIVTRSLYTHDRCTGSRARSGAIPTVDSGERARASSARRREAV
jgi:hypothetical protein